VERRQPALESVVVTPGFWDGRRVFITGHTGFKGAWLSLWLDKLGAKIVGYALPPPTTPNLFELADVARSVQSLKEDVQDLERLKAAIREAAPEIVFHLAAQSLVRLSYSDPVRTFSTNVAGTVNVLEACRGAPALRAVVVVTSDKCYEENATGLPYKESDHLGGHDPYAASKACAETVTAAYRRSFLGAAGSRIAVATARSGNVIGGGDWAADRLITDLISAFTAGKRPRLRNPRATRPWQHVLEPLSGYLMLAERLCTDGEPYAEAWNFGPAPTSTATVQAIADRVAEFWGAGAKWELDPEPQPREAPLLALDASKAQQRLGWRPRIDLDTALAWTVSWYKSWHQGGNARKLVDEQIGRFMKGCTQ
jgi:CDP-glucose 4,6-dehydratase